MAAATVDESPVVHALPGRLRIHLERWVGPNERGLEARLKAIPGVRSARANARTHNVLIYFDPRATDEQRVLEAVRAIDPDALPQEEKSDPPPALALRLGQDRSRARIAVRGLDRDPASRKRVVERLQRYPGVLHVSTSPLTGRVLIEFNHHEIGLDDLIEHVAHVELPPEPGEDRPDFPLDPKPLVQSASRTVGASLGLALLGARQLTGFTIPPSVQGTGIRVSSTIGILQGIPVVRYGVRRLFGRDVADFLVYGSTIVSLTLAGSPLGLALTAAEALRLLTEVVPRRRRWRQYEERLSGAASAEPGDIIRVESGERTPLGARVIEGLGTATDRHGMPVRVAPGETISAGARLYGGPFVLHLQSGTAFVPEPRPAPVAPSLFERYARALGRISLGYAAFTALFTRSLSQAFTALLLVSPRTGLIGLDAADVGASARVLRAGVTIVGTRPERVIRLPNSLLVDGARVLTDGFEIASVLPLSGQCDMQQIVEYAGALAAAAGAPWGGSIATAAHGEMPTDVSFDGETASAGIAGVRYELGPCAGADDVPAALRLRFREDHLLGLRCGADRTPIALVVLRPKLGPGIPELIDTCRQHGVELALLPAGDSLSTDAVARRAGISVLGGQDEIDAIRERQSNGAFVAFVSDTADAARAFNACDLAIGLASGRSSRFPAPADVLAPDLLAVAAIVDAGARREAAVRDSVGLSVVANVFGAIWGIRSGPAIERASYAVYVTALAALADGWARLR